MTSFAEWWQSLHSWYDMIEAAWLEWRAHSGKASIAFATLLNTSDLLSREAGRKIHFDIPSEAEFLNDMSRSLEEVRAARKAVTELRTWNGLSKLQQGTALVKGSVSRVLVIRMQPYYISQVTHPEKFKNQWEESDCDPNLFSGEFKVMVSVPLKCVPL